MNGIRMAARMIPVKIFIETNYKEKSILVNYSGFRALLIISTVNYGGSY
jgi:hypothetical protein